MYVVFRCCCCCRRINLCTHDCPHADIRPTMHRPACSYAVDTRSARELRRLSHGGSRIMLLLLTAWRRNAQAKGRSTKLNPCEENCRLYCKSTTMRLMKDVPGKASSKLIKTKTASGLSLPRMVLTDNKSKAAEKRTAVKPKGALQRRPSTYGDDNWVTIGETSHTFRHP